MSRTLRTVAALLAFVLAVPCPRADAADLGLDELLALFRAHPHRHDTFTERYTAKVLERPIDASGELFYDAPGRLEKRTLKPRPETLLLDDGALTVTRRNRTYHATLADYPQVAPYVDSIRATLAGDRAALERTFKLRFESQGDAWTLVLTPAIASLTAELASIRIVGTRDLVGTVAVERANGDRSVMTLTGAAAP